MECKAEAIRRLPGESQEETVRREILERCRALGFNAELAAKLANGEMVSCASEDLPAALIPLAEEAERQAQKARGNS